MRGAERSRSLILPSASAGVRATTARVTSSRSTRADPVTIVVRRVVPVLLVLASLGVLAEVAASPLSNHDTYFHLRFGHEFLHGWSLRHPGSVSTFATKSWVPTQWLPEIVMAKTESWFGLAGVAWLSGLQLCSLALTLYLVGRRFAEPLVVAPLVTVALVAQGPGLSMRPQVLSYLLAAVFTSMWLRARDTRKVPWALVPLSYLWAMCHGMWPVGLIIGLVAVVGLALDRAVDRRTWLRMLAVPVVSAAGCALTPVGPRLYPAVILVSSRAGYFAEWAPPNFTHANCLALLVLLGATVAVMLRRGRTPWFDLALVALAAAWAVYSNRTVEVAASMIVPLAASTLRDVGRNHLRDRRRDLPVVVAGYAVALAVLAVVVPHTASDPPPQPGWMDPTLSALPPGTPILDTSGFGGYLMWRYPQLDLVEHGYGDTYTDAELDRDVAMDSQYPGWDDLVRATGARYALLPPYSPLDYGLKHAEGWQVLAASASEELLIAPPGWTTP